MLPLVRGYLRSAVPRRPNKRLSRGHLAGTSANRQTGGLVKGAPNQVDPLLSDSLAVCDQPVEREDVNREDRQRPKRYAGIISSCASAFRRAALLDAASSAACAADERIRSALGGGSCLPGLPSPRLAEQMHSHPRFAKCQVPRPGATDDQRIASTPWFLGDVAVAILGAGVLDPVNRLLAQHRPQLLGVLGTVPTRRRGHAGRHPCLRGSAEPRDRRNPRGRIPAGRPSADPARRPSAGGEAE